MTISYNWLKDYINTDVDAQTAAAMLTAAGLEVEGIDCQEVIPGGLAGLVVGKVLECHKHPDADKLSITRVDVGLGDPLQIVCGAPNIACGQSVIVATVGTKLYPIDGEPFMIKKSRIRGVDSFGMICAEDEIGVGQSHDGIIVLDGDFAAGVPAADVFDIESDTILEIGLTPNRVDAASHYGVARDLAASLALRDGKTKAVLPSVSAFKAGSDKVNVRVDNPVAAPRYMGVVMRGVKIAPSAEWLQNRLRSIGINPKNNVVDITNFVLHECGQPLHAFDLKRVEAEQIVVRNAIDGTKFRTLDGVERTLSDQDLMICSAQREMCLAGVFGGEDSGINDSTTDIFIESAYFSPSSVRRSAKGHTLSTDSSWRFERGADPEMQPYALKRCALLIGELAGGVVTSEVVDIYDHKVEPFRFTIDLGRINRLIGKEIPKETSLTILRSLEIHIIDHRGEILDIEVPAYRVDVRREADIAEEILRLYGFNNIDNPPFIKSVLTAGNRPTTDRLVDTISNLLVSVGLTEIMSNSLTKSAYYDNLKDYPIERSVKIINPLSSELSVMRQTLVFNALEAAALNVARRRGCLKLFEVGNCYYYNVEAKGQSLLGKYSQQQRLAILVTGDREIKTWNSESAKQSDFYSLKALIEKIFERLGLNFFEGLIEQGASSDIFEQPCASYSIGGGALFEMGRIRSDLVSKFDIKTPVFYAELNIEKLQKVVNSVKVSASELTKYQSVRRDLALLVDSSVTFAALRSAAFRAEKRLLRDVSIFDIYQGDKLPINKKSYALSFILEDSDKTLTDGEIERSMGSIISAFQLLGAEVRS